jgi:hypothetical protein
MRESRPIVKNPVRRGRAAARVGIGAAALGLALAAFAAAGPAAAAGDIVTLPNAPTATAVACTAANTAVVSSVAEYNVAYVNPFVNCIQLANDIEFTSTNIFNPTAAQLNRPLSIDGQGHTLTYDSGSAYGSTGFPLQGQGAGVRNTLEIKNATVAFPYGGTLIGSWDGTAGSGWDVVLDGVKVTAAPGGAYNGSPINATNANLFLEGTGTATDTYGSLAVANVISEPGSDWSISPALGAAQTVYPAIDLSTASATQQLGRVWALGDLNVNGGAYTAIWEANGIYVGSNGSLTATSVATGSSFGALTTYGGANSTGQIWVDNGGSLDISSEKDVAIFAYAGAPLDIRTDPGATVNISGYTDPSWGPYYGAVTLANPNSTLQFNDPASLNIQNTAPNTTAWYADQYPTNLAINTYVGTFGAAAYPYTLDITDTTQLASWNPGTLLTDQPDKTWQDATVSADQTGLADPSASTANVVPNWNTAQDRRIFAASTAVFPTPIINPVVGGLTLVVGAGLAAGVAFPILRRRTAVRLSLP